MTSHNDPTSRRSMLRKTGTVFVGVTGITGIASADPGDCSDCPYDDDDFDSCFPSDKCMELNDGKCLCSCQQVHVVKTDTAVWEYGCPGYNQVDTVFPYISGTIEELCCRYGMVKVDWDDSSYTDGWVPAGTLEWYY